MDHRQRYTLAKEGELDGVLSGDGIDVLNHQMLDLTRPTAPIHGDTGIFWSDEHGRVRPLALVVREEEVRRLCGRYAQLHSDLSPLTSWCHLLSPRFLERMDVEGTDCFEKRPVLYGLEAAWIGLAVAEAMISAERGLPRLRISACLGTQSFAIARASAMWSGLETNEVLARLGATNQWLSTDRKGSLVTRLRQLLQPIWAVLRTTTSDFPSSESTKPFATAILRLQEARLSENADEASAVAGPLSALVPEADAFNRLSETTPEARLRLFDRIVERLNGMGDQESPRRTAHTFLAGYLATVAAGGAPSLALAEAHLNRWPEIAAWAYTIGGIGERVLWTSAFDGLGRLIARELLRPFRLDEPPTCDFSYEELEVLVDPKLKDPLVNLRIKQARVVTISLFPGVNTPIPLAEHPTAAAARPESNRPVANDPVATFAETVWPLLERRLDQYFTSSGREPARRPESERGGRSKKKGMPQTQLPLPNREKP